MWPSSPTRSRRVLMIQPWTSSSSSVGLPSTSSIPTSPKPSKAETCQYQAARPAARTSRLIAVGARRDLGKDDGRAGGVGAAGDQVAGVGDVGIDAQRQDERVALLDRTRSLGDDE